ncbi:MAG: UxaA family hydrolase [Candidatus Heimdallarchaeota archaeon]
MKRKFLVINTIDNCATALEDIPKDSNLEYNNEFLTIKDNIALGHKFALKDIDSGKDVIKYGEIIGIATQNIKEGEWIHIHNIKSAYMEGSRNE